MGRQKLQEHKDKQQASRPKRRATNAHIFRYLQTRNPSRLEETDLKRALEASLEGCPDLWHEDSASCSSSELSNGTSNGSSSSSSSSSTTSSSSSGISRMPVHHRYKPVARKNIYNEADFFHDGIMEYIEYELTLARSRKLAKPQH